MNTTQNLAVELDEKQASKGASALVKSGQPFSVADGFQALAYRDSDFSGTMDPIVMVDHYMMSQPTFGPHPHAGMSAVSMIFEDSEGRFHNRDSLGNAFDIMPGDLYWLKAGAGAIHDEFPLAGSQIHGLQLFVNLPASLQYGAPESLHVSAQHMPVLTGEGSRVRIVLGESNGIKGAQSPALPMTMLDGFLESNVRFSHVPQQGENAWVTVVSGKLTVSSKGVSTNLSAGQAIAFSELHSEHLPQITLDNSGSETVHFVLVAAKPINEEYVQKGPFVMSSYTEIAQAEADLRAGKFGSLAE
ncbi:pirin-like C-terminal cupin domain-containing protein [Alteromonas sp. KUL49]|uniref:pirin family protein n=1 Tax=Alteromonas sp. KUL49 TaxID=2480798 RepID=UPI00102F2015|nr:pirin-like C-terminal cupin domain-containing protein [Alteromonas sp. KUL49]TAP34475.1 pirin family protein [Alteromonas sp. KUL49]GEA13523.1 short-chain dehydrogenase [Alteromonas sp. KUL49]